MMYVYVYISCGKPNEKPFSSPGQRHRNAGPAAVEGGRLRQLQRVHNKALWTLLLWTLQLVEALHAAGEPVALASNGPASGDGK